MNETTTSHYGNWLAVIVWIIIYATFLGFTPFYKKSQRKPSTAYLAFIVAYALEMFGIPMSMYFIGWVFGKSLPDGIFWGHTLYQYIGNWGMYLCILMSIVGGIIIILRWRRIYKKYWSKEDSTGELVSDGIYKYIRHPQYMGFLLISLGMIFEWATIPLILMYPFLILIYYRLAKKEEADMIEEFGDAYLVYKKKTNMFIPNPFKKH